MDGGGSVKKTKGRPRKYDPLLDPNTPTPQRKRGRPRKQRLADVETSARDLWELSPNTLGGNEELPLSVHKVVSDDDLLSEILVRLPVLSLVLFKFVSKRWLSLIKDAAFIERRSRIPIIDPPSGLCIMRDSLLDNYGFASLDIRIRPRLENTDFMPDNEYPYAIVLQSHNGLFLCRVVTPDRKYYVYNPTINMFKMLPQPLYYDLRQVNFTSMDFDPTKSPHYKVVHATRVGPDNRFRIQTYSSETGIWSIVCSCTDPLRVPILHNDDFRYGIFWNDAIHWIHYDYDDYERCLLYKLDFATKTVVLTQIQLPVTMDYHCKLFESRGCLLLLGTDKTHPEDQLNIYAMKNGHPAWTFKYCVIHSSISPFGVLCIDLGEREEDSFMVIKVNREVVLYKFVLKTFRKLPELQSMISKIRHHTVDSFLFTASFASV